MRLFLGVWFISFILKQIKYLVQILYGAKEWRHNTSCVVYCEKTLCLTSSVDIDSENDKRITLMSIYIYIIIITVAWSEVPDHVKLTGTDHQIKRDAERRVWSSDPLLSTRRDPPFRIKLLL